MKSIIVGVSTSGKTTLINYLREHTKFNIGEIDEELVRLNGGIFPKDSKYKYVLAKKIIENILNKENIIFFTNTNYFKIKDLKLARTKGFKIIHLILDLEQMKKRNENRMKNEGYDDHSKYFKKLLEYQEKIMEKGFVDKVINTDKAVEDIANELIQSI